MTDAPLVDGTPDPAALRPLFAQCFRELRCDTTALHDAICATVCAYADAGLPVQRSLALVNAELRAALDSVPEGPGHGRIAEIKRLLMDCLLECYYPAERQKVREGAGP